MLTEIQSMVPMAQQFLNRSPQYTLPLQVPYIGMGSSYFAALAFKYMGVDIYPEIASEYVNYQYKVYQPTGVLLSQSGRSTEVLWSRELFEKYIAISNDGNSALCTAANVQSIVELYAGNEKYSSSKTYINTLLALFKGFGKDAGGAVEVIAKNIAAYQDKGKHLATEVFTLLNEGKINGLYITGSGPNIATALQAALIMSESTKLNFHGLPMAQYDHGPKETAQNSVVINIIARGKSYDRTQQLAVTISKAGAHVFRVEEPALSENESILANIIPFNYMAYYLSELLQVADTFLVGGKVTEVI